MYGPAHLCVNISRSLKHLHTDVYSCANLYTLCVSVLVPDSVCVCARSSAGPSVTVREN